MTKEHLPILPLWDSPTLYGKLHHDELAGPPLPSCHVVHRNNPRTLFILQYLGLHHLKNVTFVVVGEHFFDLHMDLSGLIAFALIDGLLVIHLETVVGFNGLSVDLLDQYEFMRRIVVVKNEELEL